MSSKKVLRIAELRNAVAGQIEDSTGRLHDVRQIDLETYQAFKNPPDGVDEFEYIFEVAKKLVPSLPLEELQSLGLEAARAITMMAGGGIDLVEAQFPNAVRPATAVSTSPA